MAGSLDGGIEPRNRFGLEMGSFFCRVFQKRRFHWQILILKWVRLVIFIFIGWILCVGQDAPPI